MRFFAACVPLLARRRLGDASPPTEVSATERSLYVID
jgi:hypothetical protein